MHSDTREISREGRFTRLRGLGLERLGAGREGGGAERRGDEHRERRAAEAGRSMPRETETRPNLSVDSGAPLQAGRTRLLSAGVSGGSTTTDR